MISAATGTNFQTKRGNFCAGMRTLTHVNSRRAGLANARQIIRCQCLDDGLLNAYDKLAWQAGLSLAAQVAKNVNHGLTRAMVSNLATAICLNDRNVMSINNVRAIGAQTQCKNRWKRTSIWTNIPTWNPEPKCICRASQCCAHFLENGKHLDRVQKLPTNSPTFAALPELLVRAWVHAALVDI